MFRMPCRHCNYAVLWLQGSARHALRQSTLQGGQVISCCAPQLPCQLQCTQCCWHCTECTMDEWRECIGGVQRLILSSLPSRLLMQSVAQLAAGPCTAGTAAATVPDIIESLGARLLQQKWPKHQRPKQVSFQLVGGVEKHHFGFG